MTPQKVVQPPAGRRIAASAACLMVLGCTMLSAAGPAVTFNPATPVIVVCEGRGAYTSPLTAGTSAPVRFRIPNYPDKARREHWEGAAVFEVQLDQNLGRAGNITVLSSTGHAELDAAAMAVIREATFPRKWPPFFRVPVVFTLKRCSELPNSS